MSSEQLHQLRKVFEKETRALGSLRQRKPGFFDSLFELDSTGKYTNPVVQARFAVFTQERKA